MSANAVYSRFALLPMLFFMLLVSASCASMDRQKPNEKDLLVSVDAFNSFIRWGDFKEAAAWILPAQQEQFWNDADALHANARIMGFEIRSNQVDKEKGSATVIIHVRYYRTDNPQLQTKNLRQVWEFKEKRWMVSQYAFQSLLP